MTIQLQGNAESTFANDVTIGGDVDVNGGIIVADGVNSAANAGVGLDFNSEGYIQIQRSGSTSTGATALSVYRGTERTIRLQLGGAATFALDMEVCTTSGVFKVGNTDGQRISLSGNTGTFYVGLDESNSKNSGVRIQPNGNAEFKGTVSQNVSRSDSVEINLDTGGTIDVKERLQNTQAILYRLKAALIQPDADVNTLRQRLLEALDILTSDGDES